MKIRYLLDYKKHKAGSTHEVGDKIAERLIAREIAEKADTK